MKELKEILKKHRTAAKLSQRKLAEKINIKQPYYSDIERGRCNPSLPVFSKIAAILNIDMNILKPNYKQAD